MDVGVMIVGALGFAILVAGALAIIYTDRHFWRRWHQCPYCRFVWIGKDKHCSQCQARGVFDPLPTRRHPDHDWQGHMDTGPNRKVEG